MSIVGVPMDIRMMKLRDVFPYRHNPRIIKTAVPKVMVSLKEFGWQQPIVVDTNMVIICGHVRHAAAKRLGMTEVPVHVADNLSPEKVRAYRLADNRLGQEAIWDDQLLKLEMGELQMGGWDLLISGFEQKEIDRLLIKRTKGLVDPDAIPGAPRVPRVKPRDVWRLGVHTLYCGDCHDIFDSLPRLGGVVTDPPYGIGFEYDQHDDTDYGAEGYGAWIWRIIERAEACCDPGSPVFVWQSPRNIRRLVDWFPRDWQLFCGARNFVNMTPGAMTPGAPMYHAYDAVLVWWKMPGPEPWCARTNNRDWHMADTASEAAKPGNIQRQHPCPRPADQVTHIIEQWVPPDATVFDPFIGSGTTLIAAERTGRRCIGTEISPTYCDIAVLRWEQFTGQTAICEREPDEDDAKGQEADRVSQ